MVILIPIFTAPSNFALQPTTSKQVPTPSKRQQQEERRAQNRALEGKKGKLAKVKVSAKQNSDSTRAGAHLVFHPVNLVRSGISWRIL